MRSFTRVATRSPATWTSSPPFSTSSACLPCRGNAECRYSRTRCAQPVSETHEGFKVRSLYSIRDSRYALMYGTSRDEFALFDIAADPGETEDVFEAHGGELSEWQDILRSIDAGRLRGIGGAAELDSGRPPSAAGIGLHGVAGAQLRNCNRRVTPTWRRLRASLTIRAWRNPIDARRCSESWLTGIGMG